MLVVCGECYNLGLIDRPVVVVLAPLLSILFLKIRGMTSLAL